MWGDHLHHGYYGKGEAPKSNTQAQIDMIEEVLKWAGVEKVSKVTLHNFSAPFNEWKRAVKIAEHIEAMQRYTADCLPDQ
jgi:hypothetical protein